MIENKIEKIEDKSSEKLKRIPIGNRIKKYISSPLLQITLALLVSLGVSMLLIFYWIIVKDLPSLSKLGNYDIPLSTKILDRNGIPLYTIFGEENRTYVPLDKIPPLVREATISIEDKDFYKHGGVNPIGGMLRAVYATITRKSLQGGSTITQQLVKSALLSPERTVTRKIKEIILAIMVDAKFSKDKILELYLNQVPYGGTASGIQTAAHTYFGKDVWDLTLPEASLLAGLPQAPTYYSPYGGDPERSKNRQKDVLRRMTEDGYITKDEAIIAAATPLSFKRETDIRAPHFVMYVKEKLVEKYGEDMINRGGLIVTTTLDSNLQDYAESTVAAEIAAIKRMKVSNGAALITHPATGEILAMVGSVDYYASPSGTFNVTTALRQPGSSIKPINYAIGIDRGIVTPATMFLDVPTCFKVDNQPDYCPKNYDGKFHGPVQLRFALGNSFNIPAVKMLFKNSLRDMVASASAFGLDTLYNADRYGLSLTLGGGEVRMVDMAEAFGVFSNGGIRKDLISILKITDKNGNVIEHFEDPNFNKDIPSQLLIQGPRVISQETAFLISNILSDNNARQDMFGSRSNLFINGKTVSVKTGTTDDWRDNWTIGYTPQYLVTVWVGNNDNSQPVQSLISGVSGAAPIWHTIMTHLLEHTPNMELKRPDGIVGAHICTPSGLAIPSPDSEEKGCATRFEYFIKGTVPSKTENTRQKVFIDKETQDLAAPGKTDNIEETDRIIYDDGISRWCADCPHDDKKAIIVK
jgi:1A family penicillin-binding protein